MRRCELQRRGKCPRWRPCEPAESSTYTPEWAFCFCQGTITATQSLSAGKFARQAQLNYHVYMATLRLNCRPPVAMWRAQTVVVVIVVAAILLPLLLQCTSITREQLTSHFTFNLSECALLYFAAKFHHYCYIWNFYFFSLRICPILLHYEHYSGSRQ